MSLVTLIQKLNSLDRDAIITIDDWNLPKTAKATGKTDEAGRPIFTMIKTVVANVVVETANVSSDLKIDLEKLEVDTANVASDVETDVETVVHELEQEAETLATKLKNVFHHKANT
jgi:ribosome-associated translation inhibitor RaiA